MKYAHEIHLHILRTLLFQQSVRHKDLKPKDFANSHFSFYLKQLLDEQLIAKDKSGYSLTEKGKEFANRMDTGDASFRIQPKVSMILCAEKADQYVLYCRKKNPFYDHKGFPTHKVWFGENIVEIAAVGLEEECGLKGRAYVKAIRHYHVYYKEQLVEDKIFFIMHFPVVEGNIINSEGGEYMWIAKNKVSEIVDKPLPELSDCLAILEGTDKEFFKETKQHVLIF